MMPLKTKVSITLDSDLVENIKILAEQDERSFSQYINHILKNHIKQKNISCCEQNHFPDDRHSTDSI